MIKEDEREVRERLSIIEIKMLRSKSLTEIWELKAEHKELSRLLKKIVREKITK